MLSHLEAGQLAEPAQLFPGPVYQPLRGRVGRGICLAKPASEQEHPFIRVHIALENQQQLLKRLGTATCAGSVEYVSMGFMAKS